MRKFFLLILFFSVSLFASSVNLHKGWNLIGAIGNIKPSSINSAKTVWVYRDENWSLYIKDDPSGNNYGYDSVNSINAGEGFWVDSSSDDTVVFEDNKSIYNIPKSATVKMYNLYLKNRVNDERYLVSNSLGTNSVTFDKNNSTIVLRAYKSEGKDSRAGINIENISGGYMASSVETEVVLKTDIDADSKVNRVQLNCCNLTLDGVDDANGCAVIFLSEAGAYYWYEKEYFDGTWKGIVYKQLGSEDMRGKDITIKVSIDGSKIIFSLRGDVNHDATLDTNVYTGATINGKIGWVEIKARVKALDDDKPVANVSEVTIKDINVTF